MANLEPSPTARALRTLEILQQRPGVSADALAERLGVSERAVRRYVEILREAGITVESTRGRYGGYRLGRGHRPAPLLFTAAEALGLVMAVLEGQHAADDDTDPVGAALDKLIRTMPETVARPADTVRRHARAATHRHDVRPDPTTISEVVDAVAGRHRIRLDYRSGSGSAARLDVDPWAVVVRFGRWYLLCFAHEAGAVRTLRVDRIESLDRLVETFTRPEDLDPVAALEDHLAASWPYEVRVTVDAPYSEVLPWVPAPAGRLTPLDGGSRCRLIGTTNNPAAHANERLAPIPFPFTVDGGPELRAAVAELAGRLTQAAAVSPRLRR